MERQYTTPDREVRTFSIAVNYKQDGEVLTPLVIPCKLDGSLAFFGIGDRAGAEGSFEVYGDKGASRACASSSSSRT